MSIPAKRVLHVFGKMNRGGAETLFMNIYRTVDRDNIQFDFLVHSREQGQYDNEIEDLGGRVVRTDPPRLLSMGCYAASVTRALRKYGPFVGLHSHVHYFSGVIMALAARCGIERRICHGHTSRLPHMNRPDGFLYRAGCRAAMRLFSTNLLGCSRQTCEALYGSHCWQDPRVEVLRNAVLTNAFQPSSNNRVYVPHLERDEKRVVIGHVGNFTVPKNHGLIVRVFHKFLHRVPTAHLLLIGDGPLRGDIEDLARALGVHSNVHFLGTRSDIPAVLYQCDLVLFPSLWEGIPVSLVEAQACGIPCVISDRISSEVDLGLGLLFPMSIDASEDEWAGTLCQLLGHKKVAWSGRLAALRKAGYDIQTVTSQLMRLYAESKGDNCTSRTFFQ
jgi:glycosyltransferase involved in cell wall biosynthesis